MRRPKLTRRKSRVHGSAPGTLKRERHGSPRRGGGLRRKEVHQDHVTINRRWSEGVNGKGKNTGAMGKLAGSHRRVSQRGGVDCISHKNG